MDVQDCLNENGDNAVSGRIAYTKPGHDQEGFRAPQVCRIIGITYRQLDYWARTGLLRPSINDARGSGTQRVYSYADLLQLKMVKQLLDAGVSLHSTRKAVGCLRNSETDVAGTNLIITDDSSTLTRSETELFNWLRGTTGTLSIVVSIDKIISEVDAAMTAARLP